MPGEVSESEVDSPRGGALLGGVPLGSGLTLLTTEDAALTNGLADIPTGLTVDAQPLELRCELLLAGNPGTEILTQTLTAVASLVATQPEAYPLQPGTVIPMIGTRARLSRRITVRHGVFVPPFMWGGQSPHMTEQPGDVHTHGASASSRLGRMTVLLQILMVTDAELNLIESSGAAGLIDQLLSANTDLMDWTR